MSGLLTTGFCELIHTSASDPKDVIPIVQILNIKKISGQGQDKDRYRVIISDGKYFTQGMLATQNNPLVESKQIDKNTVVKLTQFASNSVQGRKLIIILALEPVEYNGDKIGNPTNLEKAEISSATHTNGGAPPPNGASGGASAPLRAAPSRAAQGGRDVGPLFPIERLSPYQNKWTIKARVTAKSEIKHWSNQRGDGKLFNVTFMDETGEIRATGFNETVDTFYEMLQEGKVYFVSRARVNIAKKQFNNVNNDYEIAFERDTEIEACDDESVPKMKYNFTSIGDLESLQKDEMCDVIGIVKEVHELGSVTSKATNKPFAKRDIQLVDQSGQSVRLTLWGKQAENFEHKDEPVIAFKGVKVGDFGGRSLSMFSSATMSLEPDIPEAHQLRGWFEAEGRNKQFTAYTNTNVTRTENAVANPSELKTIGQVKDEQLGMNDKTEYFSTSATVAFIKQETFAYPACANPDGCNKKVMDSGSGWVCEKCERTWENPIWRYILQMNIMDHVGSIWITGFNEVAEQIMGIPANDLTGLKEGGDESKFGSYFQKAVGQTFTFQMMAKQDSFNDQPRVRYQCRRVSEPDFVSESARLVQQINLMG
ncbi:hypothetical protein BD324DRAFT_616671 [Kockovaella imperatae]|uniref:Replication protein A subunit n=1 Tax=Kockovaella imperatae TaxID=4999 RepID=A0A1Y1URE0_9TREE|nr:hypothetical protein BD324DRAFT_616671 [Kockovaella imperatae]ORX40177.1 hypothetical protein BD324DRAFT_616671 [Kockovaella imperatae]